MAPPSIGWPSEGLREMWAFDGHWGHKLMRS